MHFTYAPESDGTQLMQGDVIFRNAEIDAILQEVHPHYKKEDYKAFIILTQSCDLVRRNGGACSTRYISISAVRPLEIVLNRAFEALCSFNWESSARISNHKNREKLRLKLERLFNNNEDEYFFLFKEPAVGLEQDYCAFLQLSIAVRADLHYDKLLNAKKLQLSDSFQHKLGFLVGKMYSRVGTPDWVPTHYQNESEFASHINTLISAPKFGWLDDETYKELANKLREEGNADPNQDQLNAHIQAIRDSIKKRRVNFIGAIRKSFTDVGIEDRKINKALALLQSDPLYKASIK